MYFNKIHHPSNFVFEQRAGALQIASLGGDTYRIFSRQTRSWRNPSQAQLATTIPGESLHHVAFTRDGTLTVRDRRDKLVLSGAPSATFGRSGEAWLLQLRYEKRMRFYGLGEHNRGLEKTGQRVKFWNTDLLADFGWDEICHGFPNPMYVSVPWLIINRGGFYAGLLVNHPGAVFMELASNFVWDPGNTSDRDRCSFYVGASHGEPEVYLIIGPTLPELLRKLQTLVGRTPLPPLWALGYHQCRWGYAGPRDLNWLDRELARRRIPCDGLWLDIDHMDRLKVFTFAPRHWGNTAAVRRSLASLHRRHRRVVPILDPGVKVEPGYGVYDEGIARKLFCLNRAGRPYVGFAWPGQTHFPDFSRADVREWWALHVAAFAARGIDAAWIDMNDPSTGAAESDDMLFDRGRLPHEAYHNQYALGMAEATRAGFLAARPDERPFVLSRSAFISSSRHTAVWTGDNISNWHHLRLAIPVTLGLAMSGLPFCGPDVCGFGLDATRELAIAWHKLQFLFPFFRNHNSQRERPQEPWQFGASAERILRHYIRLRYKFLPYLYQLFIAQEQSGAAILRPLFHDFPDRPSLPLGRIADQFMIGPALMQAPVVTENDHGRTVVLPGAGAWYSLTTGKWIAGGRKLRVRTTETQTPLFARDGALLPLRPGLPHDNLTDLRTVELHVFLRPGARIAAVCEYSADDGLSFDYQKGGRSTVVFTARNAGQSLVVTATPRHSGYGPIQVRIVAYGRPAGILLITPGDRRTLALRPHHWRATGATLDAVISDPFEI